MEGKEIKIDYLSATFPLVVGEEEFELIAVMDTVKMIANYLNIDSLEIIREEYATLRYRYQYSLGDSITLRLSGPECDSGERTCHIELKGEGCRDFERRNQDKTWCDFILYILRLNGKFKRIDIAIDDFTGNEITLKEIYKKIKNCNYTSIFNSIPRPIGFVETGLSITFGSPKSPTQLCIYDKKIEQLNKNKLVDEDYWVRYEMRFRNDKAMGLVYELLKNYYDTSNEIYGFNMQHFAFKLLYGCLDIKKENNSNKQNQTHIDTDEKWLKFLGEVEKSKIKNPDAKVFSYASSFNYIEPKAVFYLTIRLLQCNGDIEKFKYELLKLMYAYSNFDDRRLKRLNLFLCQMKLEPFTPEKMLDLRTRLFSMIVDMEMPF